MTELPTPYGITLLVAEAHGLIHPNDDFKTSPAHYDRMPVFTADQMRDYGRAEYERALKQLKEMDWVEIMRKGQLVTWGDAATLGYRVVEAIRALAGEKT